MKPLLNNLRAYIAYDDDGYLLHTDNKTGKQRISLKTWPNLASARKAVADDLGQVEWEELKEPPPSA